MKEELLKIASESLSSDEVSEIVKEKFMNALGGAIEDAFRWGCIVKYYKLHLIRHGLTAGNLQGL